MVESCVSGGGVAGDYDSRDGCEEGEKDDGGVRCDDCAVRMCGRVGTGSVLLLLTCLFGVTMRWVVCFVNALNGW